MDVPEVRQKDAVKKADETLLWDDVAFPEVDECVKYGPPNTVTMPTFGGVGSPQMSMPGVATKAAFTSGKHTVLMDIEGEGYTFVGVLSKEEKESLRRDSDTGSDWSRFKHFLSQGFPCFLNACVVRMEIDMDNRTVKISNSDDTKTLTDLPEGGVFLAVSMKRNTERVAKLSRAE